VIFDSVYKEFFIKTLLMLKFIIIVLSIPKSVIFCLRFLPFKQAVRFPIFVKYGTKVMVHGGKINISVPQEQIKIAMIRIGFHEVPTKDVCRTILNINGELVFLGSAHIGNGSILNVECDARLILGDNFAISACSTINCYKNISFGKDIQFSWDCLVMDSDTHEIYDECQNLINEPKEVVFGDHVWIGCGALILKGSCIPSECVIAAHSVLTAKQYETFSIIAGNPAKSVKKIGGWKL
jgi:acetyltransferase-like isoleucine patch superfamily enzyme